MAVIGSGVIGASWAALFMSNNIRTNVYDTNPNIQEDLIKNIRSAFSCLSRLPRYSQLPSWESLQHLLYFTTNLTEAVRDADLIQENTPEILQLKLDLFAEIEAAMKQDALVCSSTSGIPPSQMQVAFKHHLSNFLIAHPFNPPHLIPLVEIVGGQCTSADAISRATSFYIAIGKKPIQVRREIRGHVANRLQAALFREIFYLLETETADVADIETAVEYGPGLRWGVMGPSTLLHLGGGPGGAESYASKFLPHLMSWYADRDPVLTDELKNKWVRETTTAAGKNLTREQAEQKRDDLLIMLLNVKEHT